MSPGAVSPSAVNNRPMLVVVYIALGDAGCAVAKFSKSRFETKFQREVPLFLEKP